MRNALVSCYPDLVQDSSLHCLFNGTRRNTRVLVVFRLRKINQDDTHPPAGRLLLQSVAPLHVTAEERVMANTERNCSV